MKWFRNSSRKKNQNSNHDNTSRTDNEENIFPEQIESDEESISRLASNFSHDHEDELQGCAGFSEDSDLNHVSDKIQLVVLAILIVLTTFNMKKIKII